MREKRTTTDLRIEITSRIFTATANFGGRLQVRCPDDATPVELDALKALAVLQQLFVQHFEGVLPLAGEDSVQHPRHAHRLEVTGALDATDVDDAPSEVFTNL